MQQKAKKHDTRDDISQWLVNLCVIAPRRKAHYNEIDPVIQLKSQLIVETATCFSCGKEVEDDSDLVEQKKLPVLRTQEFFDTTTRAMSTPAQYVFRPRRDLRTQIRYACKQVLFHRSSQ